jgi:hypothetical protein
MDKKKKYVLTGVMQKFETRSTGARFYPVETLKESAHRYEATISGGMNALIEHYEKCYNVCVRNDDWELNKAAKYLHNEIKVRMMKINKDHCTCTR